MNRTYMFALATKDEKTFNVKVHGDGETQLNMFEAFAKSLMNIYSPKIIHKAVDIATDKFMSEIKSRNDNAGIAIKEDKHNA